jgi:hypothetical protein
MPNNGPVYDKIRRHTRSKRLERKKKNKKRRRRRRQKKNDLVYRLIGRFRPPAPRGILSGLATPLEEDPTTKGIPKARERGNSAPNGVWWEDELQDGQLDSVWYCTATNEPLVLPAPIRPPLPFVVDSSDVGLRSAHQGFMRCNAPLPLELEGDDVVLREDAQTNL